MPGEICEEDVDSIRLPKDWHSHVRCAVLNVIGIVQRATPAGREALIANGDAKDARIHQLESEVAMLREELRINGARMQRVPPHRLTVVVSRAIRSSLRSIATKAIDICPSSGLDAWHERDDARTAGAIRMREHQLSRLVHPDCQRSSRLSRCRHWSGCLISPVFCVQVSTAKVDGPIHRRQVVHLNVTTNPYAEWTAQQIVDAFPDEEAPRFLLRDRDGIYGPYFQDRMKGLRIEEFFIAPRAPWQNRYCERIIGSIRRECLDHVIILNEAHLKRMLTDYFEYYHLARPHLSLDRNSPTPREVEPPPQGKVISIRQVGGLHHRYSRAA